MQSDVENAENDIESRSIFHLLDIFLVANFPLRSANLSFARRMRVNRTNWKAHLCDRLSDIFISEL